MKQHSTARAERTGPRTTLRQIQKMAKQQRLTIGLDLGDKKSHGCLLNEQGEVVAREELTTTKTGLNRLFEGLPSCVVALEVGTHSLWVSWHLTALGHLVVVGNARKLGLITQSQRKNDRIDAEKLARLVRADPALLSPVRHRSRRGQEELAVLRARGALVESRTKMINAARGLVKPFGERLKGCDADAVGVHLAADLPEAQRRMVEPLLRGVEAVTKEIKTYEGEIAEVARRHPEIKLLTAVFGVGELVALTFILTIEEPGRFGKSREIGPYVGLTPGQDQSGNRDVHLPVTKEGDKLLRSMLVQSAHCIMRHDAPDSDLRRWACAKLAAWQEEARKRGARKSKGKKRVLVALARRLAVLLHRLWVCGEVYDPLYAAKKAVCPQRQAA